MFLASMINAKSHLISGMVVGALLLAATRQVKYNCRRCEKKCNSIQPTFSRSEDLTV